MLVWVKRCDIWIIVALTIHIEYISTKELQELELKRKLFNPDTYDRTIRPRYNREDVVNVSFTFYSVYIIDLNWKDEFLTWNKTAYGEINDFVTEGSKIWDPDITILGRLDKVGSTLHSHLARVRADGFVDTSTMGWLTTHCSMNPKYFPFDYQFCDFKLSTWTYKISEVALTSDSKVVLDTEAQSNPTWELVYGRTKVLDFEQSIVELQFCLRRRPTYLCTMILIPTSMHAALVLISYLLPSEEGEKISFGISLFLSFVVFLMQMNGDLPDVSTHIPAIEIYFLLHMLSSVISILSSSAQAKIDHHYQNTNANHQSEETKTEHINGWTNDQTQDRPTATDQTKAITIWSCDRVKALFGRICFSLSAILIVAANITMLHAYIVSNDCQP